MSGRLRGSESGTRGVRRIVRREAGKAAGSLRRAGGDEALHDARKRLKRARAGLRLIRKALGDRAYRRENFALRDAARPLTPVRDAKILRDTLEDLVKGAASADARALRRMRAVLEADLRKERMRLLGDPAHVQRIRRELKTAAERIGDRSVGRHGWSVLGAGLERVYRAGRDAFAAARARPSTDNLHEWRKQTKYLWHHLEMLEPMNPAVIAGHAKRAHRLSDHLGFDHDLAVLETRLKRISPPLPPATAARIARLTARRREALQARAFTLGARVYAERAKALVRRLERDWDAWRSGSAVRARADRRGARRRIQRRANRDRGHVAGNGAAMGSSG